MDIEDPDYVGDMDWLISGGDMAAKLVFEMHELGDRLPSSDAMIVRAGAGEILILRAVVRDLLASIDQSRISPTLRRRAQVAARGFTE